jgi:hypothetical protein
MKETISDLSLSVSLSLSQVIVAASERCLDPNPLEPPILDKLVQAKLTKNRDQSPITS